MNTTAEMAMTPSELHVLDICLQIEQYNAKMYEYFAELFADNPKFKELWAKTAQEEHNHAMQFELAMKLRKGVVSSVKLDIWHAENTLKVVKSIFDGVKKNPPTLGDSLRTALKLEEHLSDFHFACIAGFTDDSFKAMFRAMMQADNNHVQSLKESFDIYLRKDRGSV